MPDYGLRPPPYFSGNMPRGILGASPYGWTGTPAANPGNVPTYAQGSPYASYFPAEQFVYERMDWQKFKQQVLSRGGPNVTSASPGYFSNPPFMGAGQMVGPNGAPSWMRGPDGGVSRILRGYIRRQKVDATKPESFVRLYFMYNPDQVQRQYLSWNDSTTLDPAGVTGQESDNSMAAIPSLTTLTFTLYFDRQIEVATIDDHPGVMVDLQAFDVLSGNMVYTQTSQGAGEVSVLPPGMALPDNTDTNENHAGQIIPTTGNAQTMTTVVFSPSLSVQGILSGASATFTKFSPRMTPTTMALTLTLSVLYAGKANNQITDANAGAGSLANAQNYDPQVPGFTDPATQDQRNAKTKEGAAAAVAWAQGNLMDTLNAEGTPKDGHYDETSVYRNDGPPCEAQVTTAPGSTWTDCSSFVWRSFHAIGWAGTDQADLLRLGGACGQNAPDSSGFMDTIQNNSTGANRRWYVIKSLSSRDRFGTSGNTPDATNHGPGAAVEYFKQLRAGDVLARRKGYNGHDKAGHVAFFLGTTGDITAANWYKDIINLLQSGGKKTTANGTTFRLGGSIDSTSMDYIWLNYQFLARPEPWGPTTDGIPS